MCRVPDAVERAAGSPIHAATPTRRTGEAVDCRYRVVVIDGENEAPEPLSGHQRAALEARLAELTRRLADLAQDGLRWPDGPPHTLQEQSAELELEADAIRHRLGMPAAIGRPPRDSWLGWVILCAAATAAVVAIFCLPG